MRDADIMARGAQPFDHNLLPQSGTSLRNEDFDGRQWRFPDPWFHREPIRGA
jgi:hypothetical protein